MTTAISSPSDHKPSATPRRRRRRTPLGGGASDDCFSCAKKNLACDRRRPYCSQCLEVGSECSGYKTRLTWGVGVASRGKLRGLSLPVAKSAAAVPEPRTQRRSSTVVPSVASWSEDEVSTLASSTISPGQLADYPCAMPMPICDLPYESMPASQAMAKPLSWGWPHSQQSPQPQSRSHSPQSMQCPSSPAVFRDRYTSFPTPYPPPVSRLSVSSSSSSYMPATPSSCAFPPSPLSSSFTMPATPVVSPPIPHRTACNPRLHTTASVTGPLLEPKMIHCGGEFQPQVRLPVGESSSWASTYGEFSSLESYNPYGEFPMEEQFLLGIGSGIGSGSSMRQIQPQTHGYLQFEGYHPHGYPMGYYHRHHGDR
ncbi:hypothetical protein BROUX41_002075 [Berkeleyomyces rouxiae]|uniref:uncharacterized protein n=1 Tax=Berkeleyomyces rouxiae TaxID=2035830 RepID=UPI003B7ECC76